jgi:hypothetical protein
VSRRRAGFVQADLARAARAAKQLGPEWRVEIEGPVIRLVQSPPAERPSTPMCGEPETPFARGLRDAP